MPTAGDRVNDGRMILQAAADLGIAPIAILYANHIDSLSAAESFSRTCGTIAKSSQSINWAGIS